MYQFNCSVNHFNLCVYMGIVAETSTKSRRFAEQYRRPTPPTKGALRYLLRCTREYVYEHWNTFVPPRCTRVPPKAYAGVRVRVIPCQVIQYSSRNRLWFMWETLELTLAPNRQIQHINLLYLSNYDRYLSSFSNHKNSVFYLISTEKATKISRYHF